MEQFPQAVGPKCIIYKRKRKAEKGNTSKESLDRSRAGREELVGKDFESCIVAQKKKVLIQ